MQEELRLIEQWWSELDAAARARVLALEGSDHLPGDVAMDLQLAGVSIVAVGVVFEGGQYRGLYEQPAMLIAHLQARRGEGLRGARATSGPPTAATAATAATGVVVQAPVVFARGT